VNEAKADPNVVPYKIPLKGFLHMFEWLLVTATQALILKHELKDFG
jgi:hypothetical protein